MHFLNIFSRELDYQASSPDEKALVEACAKIGFLYTGEVNDILTVKIKPYQSAYIKKPVVDNDLHFERLHTLEFTSDRKRMSTLVKDRKGQVIYDCQSFFNRITLIICHNLDLVADERGRKSCSTTVSKIVPHINSGNATAHQ